jgi:hypothetical protein
VTNLSNVEVTVVSVSCGLGTTTDALEEYASADSGLQNLGNAYYQFKGKTPKMYANSCKTLKLNLGEGRASNIQPCSSSSGEHPGRQAFPCMKAVKLGIKMPPLKSMRGGIMFPTRYIE